VQNRTDLEPARLPVASRSTELTVACGLNSGFRFDGVPTIARLSLVVLACRSGFYCRARSLLERFRPYARSVEEAGGGQARQNAGMSKIAFTQGRRVFGQLHPRCPRVNDKAWRELTEVNNSQQM
jgi:hypothetical protein